MTAFVRPRPIDRPALRLVVFHHAGGSAAAYFPMTRSLPADWDVLLLDLPGRGRRHSSPALEDMAGLVARAFEDVLPWASSAPLALFGHSLGAVVAYETARSLEAGGVRPRWVGVSGRVAPGNRPPRLLPSHELPDQELMAGLTAMGGMHHRIDELPEFRERFLRLVRSDLRAVAGYRPAPEPRPLAAPLTAFTATDDPWAPPESMAGWERVTRAAFRQRTFGGGHFHFLGAAFADFTEAVAEEIRHALATTTTDRPARVPAQTPGHRSWRP
ncbi:thioesterase II family protein [Kitasatospora sp. NPDC056531]|uniref:thioesterase II family protein n=1 Tax=Kitasatospora sp. NPDC056531 TaxID=3345856 RepID=UPI00369FE4F2